jgi:hypothetical protein
MTNDEKDTDHSLATQSDLLQQQYIDARRLDPENARIARNLLCDFIRRATDAYRKGDEVTVRQSGPLRVVEISTYPETPDRGRLVDVHFLSVGFTEAAVISKRAFLEMIYDAEIGEFADMPLPTLAGGPSYITLGGWLGSQDLALRFIALGEFIGTWEAITPGRLGVTGPKADTLAGGGLVMSSGVRA